jgi:3-oxoacyl-[acyl-carrier protein] reductase
MTALITGGTRGIGLATAHLFSRNGYNIAVLSRSKPSSDSIPDDWYHIKGSTADITTWTRSAANFASAYGFKPHVLVNAAGISSNRLLMRTGDRYVEEVIDVNLKGTILACKPLGGSMVSGGSSSKRREADGKGWHSPCIINIASLLGVKGGYGSTVYAASKAGVLGFTRALALEYGRMGIRVNAIVPGFIETDMTKGKFLHNQSFAFVLNVLFIHFALRRMVSICFLPRKSYIELIRCSAELSTDVRNNVLHQIPMKNKRFGTPEEVAEAALFLAHNEYANNCIINLDGGLSAT